MKNIITKTLLTLFCFVTLSIHGQNHIIVSKKDFMLYVISSNGDSLYSAPVCVGSNYGNKTKKGDKKTPEGRFVISKIHNSSKWVHDFKDGFGKRKGAYGPFFIRLKTPPFRGIGIHGTCFPESIGTRNSEGCIRLKNEDIINLRNYIRVGNICIIESDSIR